jgi:hypothetical protein
MINLKFLFDTFDFLRNKKVKEITLNRKSDKRTHSYGDELLCARYYNEDDTQYIDLYVPLKGPVGIWMSGGADSSMLAFLLAKTIVDYKLDIKIVPMSFKRDDKPWNLWVATNVVERIEEILNLKRGEVFLNHNYCYFGDYKTDDYFDRLKDHISLLKDKKIITIAYSGLTKNPDPIPENMISRREETRDDPYLKFKDADDFQKEELLVALPFLFQDKTFVASLYNKHKLLESLFPYTRSCENAKHNTKFFKTSCGRCWWCLERDWAFSRYCDDPLKHIPPSDAIRKTCSI